MVEDRTDEEGISIRDNGSALERKIENVGSFTLGLRKNVPKGISIEQIRYSTSTRTLKLKIRTTPDREESMQSWLDETKESYGIDVIPKVFYVPEEILPLMDRRGIVRNPKRVLKVLNRFCNGHPAFDESDFLLDDPYASVRTDLRGMRTFTIDPPRSDDRDDAISIQKSGKGYVLGVHIADITALIPQTSVLSDEALRRGMSVYSDLLPGNMQSIPMFPPSAIQATSLDEGKERLTWSVFLHIDSNGELRDYDIKRSTIRSCAAFDYQTASAILNGKEHEHSHALGLLGRVSALLYDKRVNKGSLTLDNGTSYKLVTEAMLSANRIVALHLENAGMPLLYRVHGKPTPQQMDTLVARLGEEGITFSSEERSELQYIRQVMQAIELTGRTDELRGTITQSIGSAFYDTLNCGHFALGFDTYTHFTSPIRRYADLTVHRQLSAERFQETCSDVAELDGLKTVLNSAYHAAKQKEHQLHLIQETGLFLNRRGEVLDGTIVLENGSVGIHINDMEKEGIVLMDKRFTYNRFQKRIIDRVSGCTYRDGDPALVVVEGYDALQNKPVFRMNGF